MPRVFLPIFTAALLGAASARAATPSLQAADETYFQMKVPESRALYAAILDDPAAAAADRAGASRGLARIQWLIDEDATAAKATLERGLATGADLCATLRLDVRVLRESGEPKAAAAVAAAHAADCPGAALTDRLLIDRGKAELAWARSAEGPARTAALAQARTTLAGLSKLGQLIPDATRLKLGVALMASDGAAALEAWRDFFWLTDHNAPASYKADDAAVAALFRGALSARPRLADEVGLEALLVRGGFYEEARAFDAQRGLASRAAALPAYRTIAAYFEFRRRFDAATLAFNLAYARGRGDGKAYEKQVMQILAETATRLGKPGGDPLAALHDAFGIHGTMGETGGVQSVHAGHVVEDNQYAVDQFGRHGTMRFVSVDNMISNGYQSWLWDGLAATGGWSSDQDIVQVRAGYTPGALETLASFDPEMVRRNQALQAQADARDAEALKTKAVVFLPGLRLRLIRESRDQIAAKARAEAARTGQPYERTFLKTFWDAQVGHSIYIHEGRHALDHGTYPGDKALSSTELEYRAKLSELELSEFPRMPLAVILAADMADDTPHGAADGRIMQGLVDWIAAHRGEVAGYDPAVPPAEQLDKLTDAQIHAIAHDLDPQFKTAG